MSQFTKIVISFLPAFWILGLLLPVLYLLFLKNIKRPISALQNHDPYAWSMVLFIGIQTISIFLSVFQDYFNLDRLLAISHNLTAFSFILLGYSFGHNEASRRDFIKSLNGLYLFITIACIGAFVYSTISSNYFEYSGLIKIVSGIDNDFTNVIINQQGWVANNEFPRSRVLGIFPNGTAILILIIYVILFYYSDFNFKRKLVYGVIFVLATFTTGSRNGILFATFLFLIQFIHNKHLLIFLIFLLPLVIALSILTIEMLTDLRKDSNDTRIELYRASIEYSWGHNAIFGLGLKPKVTEIANGELPVGSHSTLLGYFIKNGLLGGLVASFFYLYFLITAGIRITLLILTKRNYSSQKLMLNLGVIFTLGTLLFDDLDSFELIPFYFGFLIYSFRKNDL